MSSIVPDINSNEDFVFKKKKNLNNTAYNPALADHIQPLQTLGR